VWGGGRGEFKIKSDNCNACKIRHPPPPKETCILINHVNAKMKIIRKTE